jgi:[ribosomal protein S5]-alanine N-acetyltransferase
MPDLPNVPEQPFPTLETERLVLREIVSMDAPALFEFRKDADNMRYYGSDLMETIDGAHELVELFSSWRVMPNPGTRWALQLRTESTLIGTCGLFKWNRNWRSCTIGYELNPKYQGKGLMTEALTPMIDWGFQEMDLNRIVAEIHPENAASISLARHLGFVEEGRLRQAGFWGGRFEDFLLFSLLRSDPRK